MKRVKVLNKRSILRKLLIFLISCSIGFTLSGCGVLKKKETPSTEMGIPPEKLKDITPEKSEEILDEVSTNWAYGPGLGSAIINIGGIVLFPPYAIYVLGNAGIEYAGYEGLYVSKLLPDPEEKDFNSAYNSVASVPGKIVAGMAGEEYRTKETIAKRYEELLK